MKKNIFLPIIILMILFGCSYSVYQNNLPHLKTVRIYEFVNNSTEYELGTDIQNSLIKDFNKDRILKTVTKNPDCSLEGTILDYEKKIRSFSDKTVKEYELRMLISFKLTDLEQNKILYENKSHIFTQAYSNDKENAVIPRTEKDAQEKIFGDLYDDIVSNVFQAW